MGTEESGGKGGGERSTGKGSAKGGWKSKGGPPTTETEEEEFLRLSLLAVFRRISSWNACKGARCLGMPTAEAFTNDAHCHPTGTFWCRTCWVRYLQGSVGVRDRRRWLAWAREETRKGPPGV